MLEIDGRQLSPESIEKLVKAGQSWSSFSYFPKLSGALNFCYLLPHFHDPKLFGVRPPNEWLKEPKTPCKPAIIYCTWSGAGDKVDLEFVKKQTEAFKKWEIQPDVFIIDAGWFVHPGDWLSINKRKFPHGLKEATKLLQEEGMEPWLWWGPYNVDKKSELAKDHPDWLATDRHQKPISLGIRKAVNIPSFYALNPKSIDVQNYFEEVGQKIKDWGFKGVKLDYLANIFFIPGINKQEKLQLIHQTIKSLKDKGLKVLACGCPFSAAVGATDYIRVSNDSGLPINNDVILKDAAKQYNHLLVDGVVRGVRQRTELVKEFGMIPDPDMFYQNNLGRIDVRRLKEAQEFSVDHGGCLTLGDDFASLSPQQIGVVKELVNRFPKPPRDMVS